MIEDKVRWNKKYTASPMPSTPSSLLREYLHLARPAKALDLACGTGRNTTYLAQNGFLVDAVDISDKALAQIPTSERIRTIEADLDTYVITPEAYSLVIDFNFLDRRLFSGIEDGLEAGGLLLFETFVQTHEKGFHQPSTPSYLLEEGELSRAFSRFDIIKYEERISYDLRGEKVKVASLVAKKPLRQRKG